jgi:DNA-binding NtrC family response regulator
MDYTILLIDDELEMCVSLAKLLNRAGYRTLYTTNPLETAGILAKETIDLIIMDLKMPEMGGIDLLKAVKKRDPSIAVIMLTAYPNDENIGQAIQYGAVSFYTKPLKFPEILEEIHELAARNPSQTSLS